MEAEAAVRRLTAFDHSALRTAAMPTMAVGLSALVASVFQQPLAPALLELEHAGAEPRAYTRRGMELFKR
jgi:hypothetical protein